MTDMDIKEIALVEDLAALGKIYTDCHTATNELSSSNCNAANTNVIRTLNLARQYAAEQILRKIRDYAADINKESAPDEEDMPA